MRLLRRYAHERCSCSGRAGAKALCAGCLGRDAFFAEGERAALAWTEAVTKIGKGHVPDSVYEQARRHFSEKELVDLTLAIVAINVWNRLAISF